MTQECDKCILRRKQFYFVFIEQKEILCIMNFFNRKYISEFILMTSYYYY